MKNSMNISLSPVLSDYELLDSGDFEKLERFGRYVTRRPEPQAIWHRSLTEEEWRRRADAAFLRDAQRRTGRVAAQTADARPLDGGLRPCGDAPAYAHGADLVQTRGYLPRAGGQLEFHLRPLPCVGRERRAAAPVEPLRLHGRGDAGRTRRRCRDDARRFGAAGGDVGA